jgi:UDP-3-O-[3-hydroxymyristoyl] glucosamine N-acyltransferase
MNETYIARLSDVKTINIGKGTTIWQYVVILEGAVIGENCNINAFCFIENDVTVGNNVTIKSGVQLWDGIVVEDDVFIGPNATFTNDLVPRSKIYPEKYLKTVIKKGASIGANSTILPGVTIGAYSLIGASSVVRKNIGDYSLYMGNPAEFVAFICKCGEKLDINCCCPGCGMKYEMIDKKLRSCIK